MIASHHRHILWDWNGTLVDDLELCIEIVNQMLMRHGHPVVDRARYRALFDFPVRGFYERLGFDMNGDAFAALSREFIGEFHRRRDEQRLHPGVAEMLAAVRDSGRQQSILSAHEERTLREIVSLLGIEMHFAQVAGLDDTHARGKIERGRSLVTALAVPPREMVLVGDTLHDLEVARALGIDCVLVAHGHHDAERLRASGVPVAADLRELLRASS
jgi:phosphoglycolate phosphatase